MTTIDIPGYITRAKSLTDMVSVTADLLARAEVADLPAPGHIHLYHGGQEVQLGFPRSRDSFRALARWAECFGGTVTGEPYTRDDGEESVHCKARFPYGGVSVEAYAFIAAEEISGT
jgi:hypothetical protein